MSSGDALKVLQVCPAYFPIRGGIEVLVETTIPLLREKHSVISSVLAPRHHHEREDDCVHNGARVHSVDLFKVVDQHDAARAFASIFAQVRKVLVAESPDVVHIHGFSPLALAAASTARTFDIPYVAHIHGVIDPNLPPHFLRLISQADHVISVSRAVHESLAFLPFLNGDRSIIPNGISRRSASWPPPDRPSLLVVGRLEPEKGFMDAIEALPTILERYPAASLTVVGFGGELYALQNLAAERGLSSNVQFLGALAHDDVISEIARTSLVLVPSRVTEGFSLVAAEAAMLGRPVIATRVGGLAETVVHRKTGIVVGPEQPDELARAVIELWDDRDRLLALATNAVSHAARSFDIDRFVDEVSQCYFALCLHRKKPL